MLYVEQGNSSFSVPCEHGSGAKGTQYMSQEKPQARCRRHSIPKHEALYPGAQEVQARSWQTSIQKTGEL